MNKNYNIEIGDDITVARFIDKPKSDDIRMSIDAVAEISNSGLRLWGLGHSGRDLTSAELGEVADEDMQLNFVVHEITDSELSGLINEDILKGLRAFVLSSKA